MTLATLRNLTRQLVGDPQGSTYSPEMCQDAINFACKEYAKKTGMTYVEDLATLDTVTGLVTVPTDYIRINRVISQVAGAQATQLMESTFQFESLKNPAWQMATAAQPLRWVLWSGAKVKVTPIPSSLVTITIGYVEYPASLTTDGMTVDDRIPDAHAEYLKYAAAAYLLLLDGDNQNVQLADSMINKFNQLIGYSDPVLDQKIAQTRTQAAREM